MNIYITKTNEEWLRSQEPSMSGLVNRLLEKERGATPLQVAEEGFKEALSEWPKAKPAKLKEQPHKNFLKKGKK